MAQDELKYLALGDSYTIGEGVDENSRFPVQLSKRLRSNGFMIEDPEIIARTGWTTSELLRGIKQRELNTKFDIVTLLIGVNNQYRGEDTSVYRDEFKKLLEISIQFTKGPSNVIVLSIPDWGVTPFAQNKGVDSEKVRKDIQNYNNINKSESKRSGVHYVDITDISRKIDAQREMLAEDGLHPSKKMYSFWVDSVFMIVKKILAYDEI